MKNKAATWPLRLLAALSVLLLTQCARAPENAGQTEPPRRGTLVLVHGFCNTGARFHWMKPHLEDLNLRVLTPDLKPACAGGGLESLARQLKDLIDRNVPPDEPLYLVGFSMGGLVSRYYLQRLGGLERVRRFAAISSPQRGTLTAWLAPTAGARQMRPDSPFLRDLNSDVDMLAHIPVLSLWTPFDLMVVPPKSSVLPVGENQKILSPLHPLMLTDREAIEHIRRFLMEE